MTRSIADDESSLEIVYVVVVVVVVTHFNFCKRIRRQNKDLTLVQLSSGMTLPTKGGHYGPEQNQGS